MNVSANMSDSVFLESGVVMYGFEVAFRWAMDNVGRWVVKLTNCNSKVRKL